ncbi:MAG: hypothetical protein ACREIA_12235, partial [Opitutaceae bacterium]
MPLIDAGKVRVSGLPIQGGKANVLGRVDAFLCEQIVHFARRGHDDVGAAFHKLSNHRHFIRPGSGEEENRHPFTSRNLSFEREESSLPHPLS